MRLIIINTGTEAKHVFSWHKQTKLCLLYKTEFSVKGSRYIAIQDKFSLHKKGDDIFKAKQLYMVVQEQPLLNENIRNLENYWKICKP